MADISFGKYRTELDTDTYGYNHAGYIKTPSGVWVPQMGTEDGYTKVVVSDDGMEMYGTSNDTKPSPSTVKKAATFFEMDTTDLYMSDGESQWHKIT